MTKTKLVIFDCDGVLVDSEVIGNRIHAEALTSYGYPITSEESSRRFTGLSENDVCQMLLDEANIRLPLDYWALQKPNIMKTYQTELNPLMQSVLKHIYDKGVQRCVASNSGNEYVKQALIFTEQFDYFNESTIFTFQQVQKGKPAPDLYLFAARQMGFHPKDCIVIEDSSVGITAALAAGMPVIGFLGGKHAQYSWYRENIQAHQIPIAHNCQELLEQLDVLLCNCS